MATELQEMEELSARLANARARRVVSAKMEIVVLAIPIVNMSCGLTCLMSVPNGGETEKARTQRPSFMCCLE